MNVSMGAESPILSGPQVLLLECPKSIPTGNKVGPVSLVWSKDMTLGNPVVPFTHFESLPYTKNKIVVSIDNMGDKLRGQMLEGMGSSPPLSFTPRLVCHSLSKYRG